MPDGVRKPPCQALQIGEHAIAPLVAKLIQSPVEKAVVIHDALTFFLVPVTLIAVPGSLLTQSELLRGGDDPVSLMCIVSEGFDAVGQRLLCEFGFAEHHARLNELDPSVGVAR